MSLPKDTQFVSLINDIAVIVESSRRQVRQTVNHIMVQSYWQIGRLIVEHEQKGESRAAYGKQQLQLLSKELSAQLGKGFDVTNGSPPKPKQFGS